MSAKPGNPFDAALKPWSASGPISHDSSCADADLELLVALLDAAGEVGEVTEQVGHVEVEVQSCCV